MWLRLGGDVSVCGKVLKEPQGVDPTKLQEYGEITAQGEGGGEGGVLQGAHHDANDREPFSRRLSMAPAPLERATVTS